MNFDKLNFNKDLYFDIYNTVHIVIDNILYDINIRFLKSIRYNNPKINIVVHVKNENFITKEISEKFNLIVNKFENCTIDKDYVRLYILYLYGGMILDLDMINLKPLSSIFELLKSNPEKIICCNELQSNHNYLINDGMLLASSKNKLIENLMKKDIRNFPKELKKISNEKDFHILPFYYFNPISYFQICDILQKKSWFKILEESYCVNLFIKNSYKIVNGFTSEDNNLLNKIIKISCGEYDISKEKINFENVSLVISRFKETPDEVKFILNIFDKLKPKVYIYNKGPSDFSIQGYDVFKILKIDNVGREGQTWLHHIVENYDMLSDIIYFIPASFINKQHLHSYKNIIKSIEKKSLVENVYAKINYKFTIDSWSGTHNKNSEVVKSQNYKISDIRPFGLWFEKRIKSVIKSEKYMNFDKHGAGGIIQATRPQINRILLKDWKIWNQEMIDGGPNPEIGHYWERTWGTIFR